MKLLIHHHAIAFQDDKGIYVQSFIGEWVKTLSSYFDDIGLLLFCSSEHLEYQDTLITERGIKMFKLPKGGKLIDYWSRKKQIVEICMNVSTNYDILLIRGITPKQWTVWQHCNTPKKSFLLVGSLYENQPSFGFSKSKIVTWFLTHVRRFEFKKITRSGIILANSPLLVNEIKQYTGCESTFIPTNTLSDKHIPKLTIRPIKKVCHLLFCGRVVQDKGIEELIHALKILNEKFNNKFNLTLIGPVKKEYQKYLNDVSTKLGIAEKIKWLGFIPFGERLFEAYRLADIFVLPSYHEGFPHSIWEAGANSVPVITTKVGGIPGIVNDEMVFFIEKKSAISISDTIFNILNDPDFRNKKVEALYNITCLFTIESGCQKLYETFNKIS